MQSDPSTYRRVSIDHQKKIGEQFINYINPREGDVILDFGCGTGKLAAILSYRVGPSGSVLGIDRNTERIGLARESHGNLSNLSFEVGGNDDFPGEGTECYDLVFSNAVLHWIHDKEAHFAKIFSSLKNGGRVAMNYLHGSSPLQVKLSKELGLEVQLAKYLRAVKFEKNDTIKKYLENVGFKVLLVENEDHRREYESLKDWYEFRQASSEGYVDFSCVEGAKLDEIEASLMEKGKIVDIFTTTRLIAIKE
ncbi:demethylmenaquinone methyltransferase [Nematostella vectensis]|uniref:demethylmenaquinone methyltransferase n=1 Tax=Nematostella vectensis TaxID=45351 RepID=UPI0020770EDC|nr:demethylmenaquinone methyltransferase [Nematostella vectensis]